MATFLFNFKPQFAERVESGAKRQTIRRNRADGRRPRSGDTVKLYAGLRTRAARLLRADTVAQCLGVRIDFTNGELVVDGRRLLMREKTRFAEADGFESWHAMLEWFREVHRAALDGPCFEGFCVQWGGQ